MVKKKTFEEEYKKKILEKYARVVCINSAKARELIKQLNYQTDPYLLQCIAQTYFDESLFNEDGSQRSYFEGRKLRLAEKYIIKAFTIKENCIDVLYALGKVRKAYKQYDLAAFCFREVIKLGSKRIGLKDRCTDHSLLKTKVNDSKFQLYRVYHDSGNLSLSRKYLSMYKLGLKRGVDSIFKPLEKFLLE